MTAVFVLAGCSGQDGDDDIELGPLDEYQQMIWGGFDDDPTGETAADQQNEVEQRTAACMTDQGFEYVPEEYTADDFASSGVQSGPDDAEEDPVAYAKEFGFGISLFDEEDAWSEDEGGGLPVDPNEEYVSSLSESDTDAFYEALNGPSPTDEEFEDEEFMSSWEPGGCYGEASQVVHGEDGAEAASEDPEFADLMQAMEDRWTEIEESPEVVAQQKEWSTCMEESGLAGYADDMQLFDELQTEYQELMGYSDDMDGDETPPPVDPEEEQEFQQQEIELAVASAECQKDQDEDVWRKVDLASQEKFVDQYRDELDALVAKYGSAEKGE